MCSTVIGTSRGPHQWGIRSGSVIAFQTSSRGASKTRSITKCGPSAKTVVVSLPSCVTGIVLLLSGVL